MRKKKSSYKHYFDILKHIYFSLKSIVSINFKSKEQTASLYIQNIRTPICNNIMTYFIYIDKTSTELLR